MSTLRLRNYNMASMRVIGGFVFATLMAILFLGFILSLPAINWPEEWQGALLRGLGFPLAVAGFARMALSTVTSLSIRDVVSVGTVFWSRTYPVSAIEEIEFSSKTPRFQMFAPSRPLLAMHVRFPGRLVQVLVTEAEGAEVITALRERGMGKVFRKQAGQSSSATEEPSLETRDAARDDVRLPIRPAQVQLSPAQDREMVAALERRVEGKVVPVATEEPFVETRDAAVLLMDLRTGRNLTLNRNAEHSPSEDSALEKIEAFLAECDGIFRSDWAYKGSIATTSHRKVAFAYYMAAFATVGQALNRALAIHSAVRLAALRHRVIGGVSAGLDFGKVAIRAPDDFGGEPANLASDLDLNAKFGKFVLSESAALRLDPEVRGRCVRGPSFEARRAGQVNSWQFLWESDSLFEESRAADGSISKTGDAAVLYMDMRSRKAIFWRNGCETEPSTVPYEASAEKRVREYLDECDEILCSDWAHYGVLGSSTCHKGPPYTAAFATIGLALERALEIEYAVRLAAFRHKVLGGLSAGLAFGPVVLREDGVFGHTEMLAADLEKKARSGFLLLSESAASRLDLELRGSCVRGPSFEGRRGSPDPGQVESWRFPWKGETYREVRDAAVLWMDKSPDKERLLEHRNGEEPMMDSARVLEEVEAFLAECDGILRSDLARTGAIANGAWRDNGAAYWAAFVTVDEALDRALAIHSAVRQAALRHRVSGGLSGCLDFGQVVIGAPSGSASGHCLDFPAADLRSYTSPGELVLTEPAASKLDQERRSRCMRSSRFREGALGSGGWRFPWAGAATGSTNGDQMKTTTGAVLWADQYWGRADTAIAHEAASQLLSRGTQLIRDATLEASGRVVNVIGGEVMALFPDATHAALASIAMKRAVSAIASPVDARLRICFAWGEVRVDAEGEVFGDAASLAARGFGYREGEGAGRIVLTSAALHRLEPAQRSACRFLESLPLRNGSTVEYYEMPWK